MYVDRVVFFTLLILGISADNLTFPDCQSGPLSTFPICNQLIPSRQRAIDLVSRMTTAEKITQLVHKVPAIARLGLPELIWWSEALHGIAYSPGVTFGGDLPAATMFPMPIHLGASFNMSLVHRMAETISTEARAFSNEGRAGLVFFTPNINIFRDPRWGRGQETPGEDPFLTSEYVYNLIDGLQNGDDERYLKIAADCKHFAAYDLEKWNGTDRVQFDARVTDQDLIETYLTPFETCIRDARVASIMCSYNAVNGIPSCANEFLLQTIARETYHLDGFVVSDCSAVQTIMTGHNYTHTVQDTVAVALHAGTDINCGSFYSEYAQQALDNKTIVEDDIDQALIRAFTVLVRLGYFDPAEQQPYRQITKDAVDTNRSRQLALEAAEQGIVLLKNVNKALPLNLNQLKNKTIALIGPTANITQILKGNYNGIAPFLVDPRTALLQYTADHNVNVSYAYGCHVSDDDQSGFAAAIELARVADIVIFFGGINQSIEAEARDRTYISLPDIQLTLIQQLEKISRSPLHIVMMSGGGLDLSYIRDSNKCASLLWMSYAGQSAGHAITHVLFGQYNPGGRLPITYYPASYVDTVPESDMQMRPSATSPGRTYKFYRGEAIFEFGYGLSYTTFNYSWINHTIDTTNISIKSLIDKDEKRYHTQVFRVNVTNTGEMTGSDVVLAFIIPPQQSFVDPSPPIKKLFGFQRIFLEINQTSELYFPLNIRSLLMVAENGSKWLESGSYHILIGKQQIYTIHLQGQSIQWL